MPVSNIIPSSKIAQPGVCTSLTRPASPYNGQVIYETDTGKTQVWNGSGWVMLTNSTAPPGLELVKTQTVPSSSSSVDVTSCFNSIYHNYKIMWSDITASGTSQALYIQLLVGSTPPTAGAYGNTMYVGNGGSGAFTNAPTTNVAYSEVGNCGSTYKNDGFCDIQAPNLATSTKVQFSAADDSYWRMGTSVMRNTTQYDGFRFYPSAGTLTGGTIRVYGYRNAI